MKRHTNSGFTMIEALMVIAICMVLAGIALPAFTNAMKSYDQSATVSATAAALQTTRFQAIMRGYPYEVIFTPSTLSFQLYSEIPPATTFSQVAGSATTPLPSAGMVTMTPVTCSVPLTNWVCTPASNLQIYNGSTITYTFLANGTVTTSPVGVGLQIKNSVKSNTLWISGVGDVGNANQ